MNKKSLNRFSLLLLALFAVSIIGGAGCGGGSSSLSSESATPRLKTIPTILKQVRAAI